MKTCAKHDDWLMAQLADAEFAAEYLNAASEDDDPATYLAALRKVVEARGGIAVVADRLGYESEASFSRAFKRIIGHAPSVARAEALAA